VVENGTVIELTPDSLTIGERVPGGYVFVDGAGVGDVGPIVMRDREILGRDGFVAVQVLIDRETGELIEPPEFISRGFVYLREAADLVTSAEHVIEETIATTSNGDLTRAVQDALSRLFYNETKRRPMTFAFVREI
jgi:ribonuclease J